LKRSAISVRKSRQSGFSLLEVLVSAVVLAMGLLGLAGLSIRSLAANDSAGYRQLASTHAMQVAEMVRGNRQGAIEGKYDFDSTSGAATLPSDARAATDIGAWWTAVKQLPDGQGSIAFNVARNTVTVLVRWNDKRADSTCVMDCGRFTYEFRP
jgi:type IV pilus assembly protein PilV